MPSRSHDLSKLSKLALLNQSLFAISAATSVDVLRLCAFSIGFRGRSAGALALGLAHRPILQ